MKREDLLQQPALPESSCQVATEEFDKRRHARFPVSVSAEVVDIKTLASVTGRVTDLGVGGCYVDAMSTFSKGTEVKVGLYWRGRAFQVQAIVSYAVTGKSIGMGLSFAGTSSEQGITLLEWLATLNDKPAQESPREAEPQFRSAGKATTAVKTEILQEAIEELVGLLVRKQLLTGSEAVEFAIGLLGPRFRTHHREHSPRLRLVPIWLAVPIRSRFSKENFATCPWKSAAYPVRRLHRTLALEVPLIGRSTDG